MKCDAVMIGSGQGGNPLCQRLARKGWNVQLVEWSHLGGKCINSGCPQTETMVASAQVTRFPTLAEGLFGLMESVKPVN